jgi:hypothetical protein
MPLSLDSDPLPGVASIALGDWGIMIRPPRRVFLFDRRDTARGSWGTRIFLAGVLAVIALSATPGGAAAQLPAAPTITGSDPPSPANSNTPLIMGSADADTTVDLYQTNDCTGPVEATGSAADFANPGLQADVPDDEAATFTATATDVATNVSACSDPFTYVEDSTAPETAIESGPAGLTNDDTPTFTFFAEGGSTFACRFDAQPFLPCSGPGLSHTPAAPLGEGAHTFDVEATDAAGNADPSPATRSFTVDTVGPAAPQITASVPASPANDNNPQIRGIADTGSTVSLYQSAACTGAVEASGTAAAFADPGFTVAVADNLTASFSATATDDAGNVSACSEPFTYTEDSAAPQTTIDTGPEGPTTDPSPTFTFSSEPGSSFACRFDSQTFAPCSGPGASHTPTAPLGQGPHTFEVQATDAAGNTDLTPASRAFSVDTQAPETTIDSGPTGPTNDATPTFGFSSPEPGSTFACRFDSQPFAPCSGPGASHTPAAPLGQGPHTFEVQSADAAGNTDLTPASRVFTVDAVAPETTIDTGPQGPTNDTTPTFTFSSSEPSSTFACRFDTQAFAPCSGPGASHTPAAPLGQGSHTFEVQATDSAENPDPTPESRAFTVDTVAPETTIDTGPQGLTNDATPTFGFTSSEPGSSFACRFDAQAFAPCSGPGASHTPAAPLGQGLHTFEVRATDPAGNPDQTPASRAFTVDTAAPAAPTITDTDPNPPANDNTPLVKGSAEAGSTVRLFESNSCSGPLEATGSATTFASPGRPASVADNVTVSFSATATDPAGNISACSAPFTYTEDSIAPQTTIDSGPPGITNDPTPSFDFSSSEPGSTFACRFDGQAFAPCSGPGASHTPASALSEGQHTFAVRATDEAQNTDQSPATRTFTVDTLGPEEPAITDIDPESPANDSTPAVKGMVGAGSPTQVRIYANADCSGDPAAAGTVAQFTGAGIVVEVTANARTDLSASAVDAGQHQSPCSNSIAYVHDSIAPETGITGGPSGATNDPTPSFTFSSSETGSSFQCRFDQAGFGSCPGPAAPLADGSHTFEVRATDRAGNTDQSPASRSFTVDTVTPNGVLSGAARQQAGDVKVSMRCANEACAATLRGTVNLKGRQWRLKKVTRQLTAGAFVIQRVNVPSAARKAVNQGKKVNARIQVTFRDRAGNSTSRSKTIRLR